MPARLPRVSHKNRASVRYAVVSRLKDWVLPEGTVPESAGHDAAAHHLRLLLEAWVATRQEREPEALPVQIARNLAVRWLEAAPAVGIDPDVCVLCPPPPEGSEVDSLRLWARGHFPPLISFEIVSKNHPHKNYSAVHERYAAMGTVELVVFDPLLAGPRSLGGPVALQLWRRDEADTLERIHFGPGPAYSEVLGAWLHRRGNLLAITHDEEGKVLWLTPEEHERAQKERERAQKERERVARLDAERRLAELGKRLG